VKALDSIPSTERGKEKIEEERNRKDKAKLLWMCLHGIGKC
jgi:predicted nucleic acid-binding Zn ribbon protein